MTEKAKFSRLGEFVTPSPVLQLLDEAECEYACIRGDTDLDDTLNVVNGRLRAKEDFLNAPDGLIVNYLDCTNHMQKKTGLPLLLCVYYIFYLSESAGAIEWATDFDAEKAEANEKLNLEIDFVSAVSHAVMRAFVHPSKEWRAFNRELIETVINHEDQRRMKDARELYDALNLRNDRSRNDG